MPVPVILNEEGLKEDTRGLFLIVNSAASAQGNLLYPRLFAHMLDVSVLFGFSVYVAKVCSVLLISVYGRSISATGKVASSIFQQAFSYSSSQLFAASFASLAVLYFVGLPLIFGRTPGQAVLGLRITDESGSAPSLRQLFFRLGGIVFTYATAGLICFVGLRKKDGRFLHDIFSHSIVVKE